MSMSRSDKIDLLLNVAGEKISHPDDAVEMLRQCNWDVEATLNEVFDRSACTTSNDASIENSNGSLSSKYRKRSSTSLSSDMKRVKVQSIDSSALLSEPLLSLPKNKPAFPCVLGSTVVEAQMMTSDCRMLREGDRIMLKHAQNSNRVRVTVKKSKDVDSYEVARLDTRVSNMLIPLMDTKKITAKGSLVNVADFSVGGKAYFDITVFATCLFFNTLDEIEEMLDKDVVYGNNNGKTITTQADVTIATKRLISELSLRPIGTSSDDISRLFSELENLRQSVNNTDDNHYNHDDHDKGDEVGNVDISHDQMTLLYGRADWDLSLPEAQPSSQLTVNLRSYQKQALGWMLEREQCKVIVDDSTSSQTTSQQLDRSHAIHPLWAEYALPEGGSFYISNMTGYASLEFPSASTLSVHGGILADEMGMGKTVEMIALIMTNLSYTGKRHNRLGTSTLVVCPLSLVGQWRDDVLLHTQLTENDVYIFYGKKRNSNVDLLKYPIIITTYGCVISENKRFVDGKSSPLFDVTFTRVALDEGHLVKNPMTETSRACTELNSKYRWVITGTPIQNSLYDIYSLLRFLKASPWNIRSFWEEHVTKPFSMSEPRSVMLVRSVLHSMMLRRTKSSCDSSGKLILTLPPLISEDIELGFSDAERCFYDALYERSQAKFDEFALADAVSTNYMGILELLLRLRQCCNHPFLICKSSSDVMNVKKNISCAKKKTHTFTDINELMSQFIKKSGHRGNAKYIEKVTTRLKMGSSNEEDNECAICLSWPCDDPVLTICGHSGCRSCMEDAINQMGNKCPICLVNISGQALVNIESVVGDPTVSDNVSSPIKCKVDLKGKKPVDVSDSNAIIFEEDVGFMGSSKIDAILRILADRNSSPKNKTIIFSQWTSMLDIIEILFKQRNVDFQYVRLDGSMDVDEREASLGRFREDDKTRVFLLSTRSAAVGINLTSANAVILCDLWFNPAIENQSIGRVHRIGQTSAVHVFRLIIKSTIEQQIINLQRKKGDLANQILNANCKQSERINDLYLFFKRKPKTI